MSQVITATVSDELVEQIDRLAGANGRSREFVIVRLLEIITQREIEFFDMIEEGRAAIKRGDFYTQEEMEEWAGSLIEERSRAA